MHCRRSAHLFRKCAYLCATILTAISGTAATVNVRVQSAAGPAASQIPVTILKDPARAGGTSIYGSSTDATGQVSLSISPGNYFVCASSIAAGLLDSCLWPNGSSRLVVSPTDSSIQVNLTLQLGTLLKITVRDPQGLVPTSANPQRSGFLQPGVFSGGHWYPAQLASSNSNSLVYQVLVPPATQVFVSFQAVKVKVLDVNGQPIAPSLPTVGFTTLPDESNAVHQFSVVPGG